MKTITEQMVEKYGDEQIVVAIEELSELTKELCKALRGQVNTQNIIEELADCRIVLEEMQHLFNITDKQLSNQIFIKLQRTKERYLEPEMSLYERLCVGCEREAWCHEHCEYCDEYEEALEEEDENYNLNPTTI